MFVVRSFLVICLFVYSILVSISLIEGSWMVGLVFFCVRLGKKMSPAKHISSQMYKYMYIGTITVEEAICEERKQ